MESGVYKITNLINGKFYIGSSKNLNRRKAEHTYRRKNLKYINSILKNAVLKYGYANFLFEIVEIVENVDFLCTREQYWIDTLKPEYNMRKIAKSNLGLCSDKQRNHLRQIAKLPRNRESSKKAILQIDSFGNVIKEWTCGQEVEKCLNLSKGSVCRVASGEWSHTKSLIFKYK